jgi:transposase
MSSLTVFVGLDYHQKSVQVCVLDAEGKILINRSVDNDLLSICEVVRKAVAARAGGRPFCVQASIEACSGAANLVEELMRDECWHATLAHPGIVNRMKQNPDKSDCSDAYILADLKRIGYLPKVWLAPEEIRELRALVRHRQQLVKRRTAVKLRIRAILRELRIPSPKDFNAWTLGWMAWLKGLPLSAVRAFLREELLDELQRLEASIKRTEQLLKKLVANDAVYAKLLEQDGVGFITAVTMRAEIAQFDRFDSGKQLARYCGVTPRNASSGEKQADAGLVKAGNGGLRVVLIEAAQRLINFNAHWGQFAQKLLDKGKPRNVVVAAVANRWLRRLYHQMQPEQLVLAT